MKVFGNKSTAKPPVRADFTLKYIDGEDEVQEFVGKLAVRSDGAELSTMLMLVSKGDPALVASMTRMLAKQMDNKDGLVKASWKLEGLVPPSDLDADELEEWEPQYRGPDGVIYPYSDTATLEKWQDQATWTTKRRWAHLMNDNDDAIVDINDLMEVAEYVIELATNRPTVPQG
jgi:hypothetical protein